jgi:hypothetical protein
MVANQQKWPDEYYDLAERIEKEKFESHQTS